MSTMISTCNRSNNNERQYQLQPVKDIELWHLAESILVFNERKTEVNFLGNEIMNIDGAAQQHVPPKMSPLALKDIKYNIPICCTPLQSPKIDVEPIVYGSYDEFMAKNKNEYSVTMNNNNQNRSRVDVQMYSTYSTHAEKPMNTQTTLQSQRNANIDKKFVHGFGENFDNIENAENELKQKVLKDMEENRPPGNYTCKICSQKGHFVKYCPEGKKSKGFTPYQGEKKSFGLFRCQKCFHKWQSIKCLANSWQMCNKCKIPVVPSKMFKLDEKKKSIQQ